jgi:putative transcriptional regulator
MLKELRKESGLTQMELARKLNVKQNTISNWENGKSKPDIIMTTKLAEVLGVTTDEVIACFVK